jgi:aminobenzoyl-glutamate utilization protein B
MPRPALRLALLAIALLPVSAGAQDDREAILRSIDALQDEYAAIATQVWEWAEVGYQEERSSARLQEHLRAHGFDVETGVAEMPTAFIASYGSGAPVIAVLAEFDALPGISQAAVPERSVLVEGAAGHACGHHLFGTASTAAGVAIKEWLAASGRPGTIRVYGTPAEEGGAGKVYMVRAGLFDDVDAALHWHPDDHNNANPETSLANKSAKFRFTGLSAHAAAAPDKGRSALDGVEAMNHMVNLMREHVPQETRIHYVITAGGYAPNVIPDFAEVFYYVRHPDASVLPELWSRVEDAARGAALGTGTTVEWEVIHGLQSLVPNDALQRVMYANLETLGGFTYSDEEQRFAEELYATLNAPDRALGTEQTVAPYRLDRSIGSTDVGDVSWVVPTAGLATATWVPGTSAHSWQAVAAGGMGIGIKGMMLAARVLALTGVDLFESPEIIERGKDELRERRGPDWVYVPLLGDRAPPLDYRR